MNNIIEKSRRLKSSAMILRDRGDFAGALIELRQAEAMLREALSQLKIDRRGDTPGILEGQIANQLLHVLGSTGGVYRRQKEYVRAASAYDAGYEFEQPNEYGIVNSYNLTQRLVTRAFINPRAVETDETVEGIRLRTQLLNAKEQIAHQINGRRSNDEYALADMILVCVLLGDPEWKLRFDELLRTNPSPYAMKVTHDVLLELQTALSAANCGRSSDMLKRVSEAAAEFELVQAGAGAV